MCSPYKLKDKRKHLEDFNSKIQSRYQCM